MERAIDEGNEDEERRLMYVLITRAREHLVVTNCSRRMIYGQVKDLEPSRFLNEIPDNLISLKEFPSTRPAMKTPASSWKPR